MTTEINTEAGDLIFTFGDGDTYINRKAAPSENVELNKDICKNKGGLTSILYHSANGRLINVGNVVKQYPNILEKIDA